MMSFLNFLQERGQDDSLDLIEESAEYQGKKVTLNKPFRNGDGPKKFSVYVKNDRGNVVKVNFGDPNLSIKKHNPERRKSFMARHKCSEKKIKRHRDIGPVGHGRQKTHPMIKC